MKEQRARGFSSGRICKAAEVVPGEGRNPVARSEIIFAVEEDPEGGYVAEALGHAIVTQGETLDELRRMVRDAVRCHFDAEEMPRVIRLHFLKEEVLTV